MSGVPVAVALVVVVITLLVAVMMSKKGSGKKFLDKSRQKVKVSQVEELSHDTKRVRLALPDAKMVLGLPVGKHFKVFCPNAQGVKSGEWNGKADPEADSDEIERKYTPTSSDDDRGYVDLVVKVYKGGVIDRFPDGGKMSQHIGKLAVGDELEISGPWGMIEYKGHGTWFYGKREIQATKIGMMAGGTGITPMLQIVAAVLKDPSDRTQLSLIFANQTEDDILVRDHLERLQSQHPKRFHLWYTLDRPPTNWKFSKGFIDVDMIKAHLPAPDSNSLILMCGPPPMVQYACKANLDKLGYTKKQQLAF